MVVGEKDGYTYGEDGKLIADKIFITINGDVYYVINNVIVYNIIIIDGNIYDFGDDGKMVVGEKDGYTYGEDGKLVANEIFITINGDVYYVINNIIVYNIIIIDGNIYDFGDDGKMVVGEKDGYTYGEDGKLVADKIFITINGDVYYVINNVIVYNIVIIDGNIYDFGDDGKMIVGEKDGYSYDDDGKLVANEIFITINGDVYYVVNNVIVVNIYMVIDGRVYFFDENGIRLENATFEGYEFNELGYIVGSNITVTVNTTVYYIIDGYAYESVEVVGVVYESDNDTNIDNNAKLANVDLTITVQGVQFSATSHEDGSFNFGIIPAGQSQLTGSLQGYIDVNTTVDTAINDDITIVMDRQVSNNLSGQIVVADTDLNPSNNQTLSGALVTLERRTSTNTLFYETTTDYSGNYSFSNLTAGVYSLTVSKEGYIEIKQTVNVRYNETNIYNIAIEAIPVVEEEVYGYASGVITDARTGYVVSGMTIYVYAGLNNHEGEHICKVVTNSSGVYTTEALVPGNYTAYVVDERELDDEDYRYTPYAISIKVMGNTTISGQGATISNSVGLTIDGMRIVLTWGSTPSDLDSHLLFGSNHVFYSNKQVGNCSLDVDDTSAYGPETITISTIENYTYKYYIYNFSKSGTMSNARAVVTVYFGNSNTPAYTFNAPSGSGYYWNIFTYNATTGEFTVVNQVSSSSF